MVAWLKTIQTIRMLYEDPLWLIMMNGNIASTRYLSDDRCMKIDFDNLLSDALYCSLFIQLIFSNGS